MQRRRGGEAARIVALAARNLHVAELFVGLLRSERVQQSDDLHAKVNGKCQLAAMLRGLVIQMSLLPTRRTR